MTKTKYISVSTDPDTWGEDVNCPADIQRRDAIENAARIRYAAEEAGIEVVFNERLTSPMYDEEGDIRDQIDWYTTWSREGSEWTDEEWLNWFATA